MPVRWTPQRAAVLDIVRRTSDHPTARDVLERVRERQPGIGVATVYRTLELLVEQREVLALTFDGDAATRYDANTAAHHHARCTACGAVVDVAIDVPDQVSDAAARHTGFVITGCDVVFRGRCPGCAARE